MLRNTNKNIAFFSEKSAALGKKHGGREFVSPTQQYTAQQRGSFEAIALW